jgi:hypothetical protein
VSGYTPMGTVQVGALSIGISDEHQRTWCCIQKLCLSSKRLSLTHREAEGILGAEVAAADVVDLERRERDGQQMAELVEAALHLPPPTAADMSVMILVLGHVNSV